MSHENKGNFLFCTFLFVITFSESSCSQYISNTTHANRVTIINNISSYKNSISYDNNKKIVLLKSFVQPLVTNFKYATDSNFTHQVLYTNPVAYVRLPVATALKKIQEDLAIKGLGLKFFDAYRPWSVTKKMWEIVPDERYAANPAKGSGHNRGVAVDVTLVKLSTGQELDMPTSFDNFSEKAHHNYMNLPAEVLQNRSLLKITMEKYGFQALATEWWHYSLKQGADYDLLDLSFKQLKELENRK